MFIQLMLVFVNAPQRISESQIQFTDKIKQSRPPSKKISKVCSPFGCLCSNYRQSVLKAALLCTSLPKTESSTTTQLLRRRRACSYEKNTAATAFLRFYCCFKTEDVEAKSSLVVGIVSTPEKITTTSSTQVAASDSKEC